MRIGFVGNHGPANTETHIAAALREWGETVYEFQLSPAIVRTLPRRLRNRRIDILFWMHSSHLCPDNELVGKAIQAAKDQGILTVAFHLDRYWDLREDAIANEPWFHCDLVLTADGGNQDRFADAGINHIWCPPACHGPDAELIGIPRQEHRAKVAFVGSWQKYHKAWPWRLKMIELLRKRYGEDFRTFPAIPRERIYGQALSDLYASVDVVVGDSIFAGTPIAKGYVSDRPYLTLGQGGCLAFPRNSPLEESFTDGEHLLYFNAQEPHSMFEAIDTLLDSVDLRMKLRHHGKQAILDNHLYRHRVREMIQLMTQQKCSILGWPGLVRPFTHDATAIRETWLDDVYQAKGLFKEGDLVLDCGANIGAFTIFAALQGANVIAVEPVPSNREQLKKNIELAGVKDKVTIWECAVGEKHGTITLGFFDTDKSQSAYRSPDGSGEIEVLVQTLASLIDGQEIDFMKMDIEGSERWALPGAPLHLCKRIAIETHNTLDPGTTHERVKGWLAPTHDIVHESGGHSEGYVISERR